MAKFHDRRKYLFSPFKELKVDAVLLTKISDAMLCFKNVSARIGWLIYHCCSQNENFTVETGKQPITFENPMYTTKDSGLEDVSIAPPTQVREKSST